MATHAAELTRWLIDRVCEETGLRPAEVDIDLPLSELGIGSVSAAGIAAELTARLGREVPVALAFEHPTIRALASALSGDAQAATVRRAAAGGENRDDGIAGAVAIVGMSVRAPGADSAGSLWRLLQSGGDPVTEVPPARWRLPEPLAAAERGARFAGLLSDIDMFDAGFFRVNREEASRMDPQQRLLLQGTWEALEDAGQVPARLAGGRVGVYVGISGNDYVRRQFADPGEVHALTPTANALSIAANRISYLLDLRGPSMSVDTACSSSLVAVHLALRELRSGGSDLAIAAGVNLLIEPHASLALARAGMLAPDGRCKPFDAAADGYVRGEGCVVVVLKPLDRAVADGDRIYALVLGSEVNQDGRSNGLTAPNPAAQEAVLRGAYADARADPGAVQYVECHGTGTVLGDVIEAAALGAVVGAGRDPGRECLIGSVKSNLGHLEPAAGLAGLAKVALSLYHGHVPGTLHLRTANPGIDFAALGLRVTAAGCEWPQAPGARLAGVSSFGFGGTNAHVVLGAAPASASQAAARPAGPVVLPVSARHPEALTAAADALAERLDELEAVGQVDLPALAASLSVRRTHHPWRRAAVGRTVAELSAQLRAVEPRQLAEATTDRRIVFAFPGQAGHASAALMALAESEPLALATLRRCEEILQDESGWSLLDVLRAEDADRVLREDTTIAQPAAVAMQLALAAAWQALGIRPAEVIGHSLGEVSAAAVAGALSVEQAMRVAIARGKASASAIGTGRMLALALSEREAAAMCDDSRIAIATVNSPASVVLSGDGKVLERVRIQVEAAGVLARWVPVDYPSHSPLMAQAAAALTEALDGLDAAAPALRFWSSAEGGTLAGSPDAVYWGKNLHGPVRFADAAAALLAAGPVTVIELGAHPVLRTPLARLAADGGADLAFVATMERGADPVLRLRTALARLYELGAEPRWDQLTAKSRYVPVPTYQWRRTRYWLPRPQAQADRGSYDHPLLGRRLDLASPGGPPRAQWELVISGQPPWPTAGHEVDGRPVLAGACYLELALAAARLLGADGPLEVRNARFVAFLPLDGDPVTVQTIAEGRGDGELKVTVMSRRRDHDWLVNASATVVPAAGPLTAAAADPATARATCFQPVDASAFYAALGSIGLDYSGGYRLLDEIYSGPGTAVAAIGAPPDPGRYVLDPRVLDAAMQLMAAATADAAGMRPVVTGVRRLMVAGPAGNELTAVAHGTAAANGTAAEVERTAAAAIFDGQRLVAAIEGIQVSAADSPRAAAGQPRLHWYQAAWRRQDAALVKQRDLNGTAWLVVPGVGSSAAGFAALLATAGARVRVATDGADISLPLAELHASGARSVDLVYLAGHGDEADAGQVAAEVVRLAALISAASSAEHEVSALWLVTAGSQQAGEMPAPVRPGPAALWGLVRVLPFENPNLRVKAVDVAFDADLGREGGPAASLLDEFRALSGEPEIALRGTDRYVSRLAPARPPGHMPPGDDTAAVQPGGCYLISGGLGAIGLLLARWLSGAGAGAIGLIGRNPPSPVAHDVIAALEQAGTRVSVFTGDVAEPGVAAAAAAALRRLGPIRGVAHAAGVLDDRPLLGMPTAAIESVLWPKVGGALALDAATEHDDLDWMIHFSSAASVLGSPGQANYCAANAFLDSYGAAQRARGRSAIVVNWGAWAGDGLAAEAGGSGRLAKAYAALDPGEGIAALTAIVRAGQPRAIVLASDLRHLIRLFPTEAGAARFSELTSDADIMLSDIGLAGQRQARPALGRPATPPRTEVERRIARVWQRSLGFEQVGVHDGFFELGGDSVFANQMLLEVNRMLGVEVTAADAFDDLTVARLAELAEQDMVGRLASMSDEEAEKLVHPEEN